MKLWAVALGLAAIAVLGAGCGSSAGAGSVAPTDGAGLVNALCHRCHPLSRVQAARHDRAGWAKTITRMQSHGAQLTNQQAQAVVDYLTKRDGGS